MTIDRLVCEGDVVACQMTFVATHLGPWQGIAPTGKTIRFVGTAFDRIIDGKRTARNLISRGIEFLQLRLPAETSETDIPATDRRLQTDFSYQQPGLLRRTNARSNNGQWVVIDYWRTEADADACAEHWDQDQIAQSFMDLIDRTSIRVERFWTI
jgi:hypothetical protein